MCYCCQIKIYCYHLFKSLIWVCFVVVRFLTVVPSTDADEQLVLDIVKFLTVIVKCCEGGTTPDKDSSVGNDTFSWIGEMLRNNSGALYHLLSKTDLSADSSDGKFGSVQSSRYSAFIY